MIPVVAGALLGLYFLVQGCVLLQRGTGSPTAKTPMLTERVGTSSNLSTQGKEPSPWSTREVIQLSPDSGAPGTNTQQGKIAAALLKAGVPSPASWITSGDRSHATVAAADEPAVRKAAPGNLVQSLDFNASNALKSANSAAPHPFSGSASVQSFQWKPAVMIWGGPILTLACLYIVALHFGWL